jgi:uncharacterized protein (TIGR03382 family)
MKTSIQNNLLRGALLAVLACTLPALAGPDNVGLGNGSDGPRTVKATDTGAINSYALVAEPLSPDAIIIPVSDTADLTGFKKDDLVLVHQAMSATGGSGWLVGRWEFARLAEDPSDSTLTLKPETKLRHAYPANVTQVIKVPEYTTVTVDSNATLKAPEWDPTKGGGVVAFLATGLVTLNGRLSAVGQGFKGGEYVYDEHRQRKLCAEKDESGSGQKGRGTNSFLSTARVSGRGSEANGGGGGACSRAGGGGGANAGAGGQGGRTDSRLDPDANGPQETGNLPVGRDMGGQGGTEFTLDLAGQMTRLTFGGGGGAGHGSIAVTDSRGGPGGGIIFVRALQLNGAGSIDASGMAGSDTQGEMAAHGGGAGGTVYLRVSLSAQCNVVAKGGDGGTTSGGERVETRGGDKVRYFVGPGGGGGGGFVLLQHGSGTCRANVSRGDPGERVKTPKDGDKHYGAKPGGNGTERTLPGGFPVLSPPVVTEPADGARIRETRPTYVGTQPGAFPEDTVVVTLVQGVEEGRPKPGLLERWSFTHPRHLPEGTYTVRAKAVSAAQGQESEFSQPHTFTVDLTKPAVDVVTPANDEVTGPRPTYSGTVEAGSTVSLAVDGSVYPDVKVTGGSWTFTQPTDLKAGSSHTVTATAKDAAGNLATDSNTFTVKVNAPPSVEVKQPAEGLRTSDKPTFSGTVSDDGPGPLTVDLRVDGELIASLSVTGKTWSHTHPGLAEGPHEVTATVTDDANQTASDSKKFKVDKPTSQEPNGPRYQLVDRNFQGGGFGCAASGGQPSALVMMGLAAVSALLARRRQR